MYLCSTLPTACWRSPRPSASTPTTAKKCSIRRPTRRPPLRITQLETTMSARLTTTAHSQRCVIRPETHATPVGPIATTWPRMATWAGGASHGRDPVAVVACLLWSTAHCSYLPPCGSLSCRPLLAHLCFVLPVFGDQKENALTYWFSRASARNRAKDLPSPLSSLKGK